MVLRVRTLAAALVVVPVIALLFASSAMASTGVIRERFSNTPIQENHVLELTGWTKFSSAEAGDLECNAWAWVKATKNDGTAVALTAFAVDKSTCKGKSGKFISSCEASEVSYTGYDGLTVALEPSFLEMSHHPTTAFKFTKCGVNGITYSTGAIRWNPLKLGTRTVAGTQGHLGDPGTTGDPIAGFSFGGSATTSEWKDLFGVPHGSEAATVSGELEVKEPDLAKWCLSTAGGFCN